VKHIVLDTNILVSALLTIDGNPAHIIRMIADDVVHPWYNKEILNEYWAVLTRQKFKFSVVQVNLLITGIINKGSSVHIEIPSKFPMTDETDRKFYDVAKYSAALLITGNIRHYPKETTIVTPAEFLTLSNT
jgi:putative PIN family toxin of toxin-antitoxin system